MRYFFAILLPLICLISCKKEIDFTYHDIPPLTVIEGQLTPEGIQVGITLTTPMDEPMNLTRLTDATVSLTDLTAGTLLPLLPDEEGYFTSSESGIVGHDYRLTVERDGATYQADATMYPAVEIISLEFNWIRMPYDHVAVLKAEFTEDTSADDDCYWVKIYRNGKIYWWGEVNDITAVDGVCSVVIMTTRMDTDEEDDADVLYDGDEVTCTISRISKAMHDYLEALSNDSNGPAMFSGDRCLGYFMASTPATRTIIFRPDSIPYYHP